MERTESMIYNRVNVYQQLFEDKTLNPPRNPT